MSVLGVECCIWLNIALLPSCSLATPLRADQMPLCRMFGSWFISSWLGLTCHPSQSQPNVVGQIVGGVVFAFIIWTQLSSPSEATKCCWAKCLGVGSSLHGLASLTNPLRADQMLLVSPLRKLIFLHGLDSVAIPLRSWPNKGGSSLHGLDSLAIPPLREDQMLLSKMLLRWLFDSWFKNQSKTNPKPHIKNKSVVPRL